MSDGASHPGNIPYYPAQLLRELPLIPRRWVATAVHSLGAACWVRVFGCSFWFLDSLSRSWWELPRAHLYGYCDESL